MPAESGSDVLIIGELVGSDLLLAEHLSRIGLKCLVARKPSEGADRAITPLTSYHRAFDIKDIVTVESGLELIKYARRCRLIVSFTGALVWALGRLWPFRRFLRLPPVINYTTGSDITELAVEQSRQGSLYRQYLDFAAINACVPYPRAIENIIHLRIPRVVFLRFPYYLIDEGISLPEPASRKREKLRFFHPSNLDWKVCDPGAHRNSSKGNDRFIRAFSRAVREGLQADCVILDRGPDREVAHELIAKLGAEGYFIWKQHLTRDELVQEYRDADVVVDQFDVGGLGAIAVESMSLGKPVMTYLQENCLALSYPESPPVLNCSSEEEIYGQLRRCRDEAILRDLGTAARKWALKYHGSGEYLKQFLFYYTFLTGHEVVKYS